MFGLDRIGTLITDDGLSDADARMLEDEGVKVIVASAGADRINTKLTLGVLP